MKCYGFFLNDCGFVMMHHLKNCFFFTFVISLLICSNDVRSQRNDFVFSQIGSKDGLSQNTVRAIHVDKEGFVWAGTLNGLNRFDGYKFLTFNPQAGSSTSLVDNRVKDVNEDQYGSLWVKTYNNEFSCYDPASCSFVNYLAQEKTEPMHYDSFYESLMRKEIWLWGKENGCLRITKQGERYVSKLFIPTEQCSFFYEDSHSVIWTGGVGGVFKIGSDGEVEQFFRNKYSITCAIELNGKIYFSTTDATLLIYNSELKYFEEISSPAIYSGFSYVAKLSNTQLVLVSQSHGVVGFNTESKLFGELLWGKDAEFKGDIGMSTDKDQGLWFYNHSGNFWYFNPHSQRFKKFNLIPNDLIRLIDYERFVVFIDSRNLIWITTYGNGLFCYNPATETLQNFKYSSNSNSLASDYLLSITEDRFGNIWIGSEYAGIIKIVRSEFDLQIIRPEKEASIGKSNNVRTILEDSSHHIWVGTKNGSLYVYDPDLVDGTRIDKIFNPYTLEEDGNNRIWVGTKGYGLYIFDSKMQQEVYHAAHDKSNPTKVQLSHNSVFDILMDRQGRMWIGTFGGGLNLAVPSGKQYVFTRFFHNQGNMSYVRCLVQDRKDRIWVGTSDGIVRFNPDELIHDPKAFKRYCRSLSDDNSLSNNDVKTIFEDKEGTIWIGTAGGGLNKFDESDESFKSFTSRDGISDDVISGIQEDNSKNLWISSENGITRFNIESETSIAYYFHQNTYENFFNENAKAYTKDGNLLWGSLNGLLVFNPDSIVPQTNVPPVTLTNLYVHNQLIEPHGNSSPLSKSIDYTDRIALSYKENSFTIEFATLALKDPKKNKYSYQLTNFDDQWSIPNGSNSATYKNLPPGHYSFLVKGCNSDGVWNDQITRLEVVINPPFWKTGYAYVFYLILIVAVVYVSMRLVLKFNSLNNNIRVEKELTNHKLRFFTNISHEFRTPLTLIRGAVENINRQKEIPAVIHKQVQILSRNSVMLTNLIDQLLEFRKLQNNVMTLDLEKTDMIKFAEFIFAGFQELAVQKMIDYQYVHDVDSLDMFIDKRKVDKIIYNLLSNAFKFTPKNGTIALAVRFDAINKKCRITVTDNGIGIDKEMQGLLFSRFMQINFSVSGTGIGLSLVKEFVEAHKGRVWYESNPNGGSLFHVELSTDSIPYEGEHFVESKDVDSLGDDIPFRPASIAENSSSDQLPEISNAILRNYKLLIIDDNEDIRSFLVDEFSKYMEVETAEDGDAGYEKAKEINPDLIICDIMMPKKNGFETTRALKEDFQTCHIPVILLTAHSSAEHQLEGIQSGADAYIMKPFSLSYVATRVFKLIEQRELLKKRFSNEYILDGSFINSDQDKKFYNQISNILEEHMSDSQFSVIDFAELAKMRRTLFYKKVKGITGMSPNELIKVKRLNKAAELLLSGDFTVSEVSIKVGFESPFYFSNCFKAHYKCSPSKYGQHSEEKAT